MSDVAVAEGDAEKGEIVLSPAAHYLLHNTASKKQSHSEDRTPQKHVHSTDCGCTLMPSGCFKIASTLEDMLCVVDFGAAAAQAPPELGSSGTDNPTTAVMTVTSTSGSASASAMQFIKEDEHESGNNEMNDELQFEMEIYALVVEELMAGYKVMSPLLLDKFVEFVKRLNLVPAVGES